MSRTGAARRMSEEPGISHPTRQERSRVLRDVSAGREQSENVEGDKESSIGEIEAQFFARGEEMMSEVGVADAKAERIARNYKEEIPTTVKAKLASLKETARGAFDTFKREVAQLPHEYEQDKVVDQLRALADKENGPEKDAQVRALVVDLVILDPIRAFKIKVPFFASPEISRVVAEYYPEQIVRLIKKNSNEDRFRSAEDMFQSVATESNSDALRGFVETDKFKKEFPKFNKPKMLEPVYKKSINKAELDGDPEKAVKFLEKIDFNLVNQSIWVDGKYDNVSDQLFKIFDESYSYEKIDPEKRVQALKNLLSLREVFKRSQVDVLTKDSRNQGHSKKLPEYWARNEERVQQVMEDLTVDELREAATTAEYPFKSYLFEAYTIKMLRDGLDVNGHKQLIDSVPGDYGKIPASENENINIKDAREAKELNNKILLLVEMIGGVSDLEIIGSVEQKIYAVYQAGKKNNGTESPAIIIENAMLNSNYHDWIHWDPRTLTNIMERYLNSPSTNRRIREDAVENIFGRLVEVDFDRAFIYVLNQYGINDSTNRFSKFVGILAQKKPFEALNLLNERSAGRATYNDIIKNTPAEDATGVWEWLAKNSHKDEDVVFFTRQDLVEKVMTDIASCNEEARAEFFKFFFKNLINVYGSTDHGNVIKMIHQNEGIQKEIFAYVRANFSEKAEDIIQTFSDTRLQQVRSTVGFEDANGWQIQKEVVRCAAGGYKEKKDILLEGFFPVAEALQKSVFSEKTALIGASLSNYPEHWADMVENISDPRWSKIKTEWANIADKIFEEARKLDSKDEREEMFKFFESAEFDIVCGLLEKDFVKDVLDKAHGFLSKETRSSLLENLNNPLTLRIKNRFPWSSNFLSSNIGSNSSRGIDMFYKNIPEDASDEFLWTQLASVGSRILLDSAIKNTEGLDLGQIAEYMVQNGFGWREIAKLPMDQFDEWKDAVGKKAEELKYSQTITEIKFRGGFGGSFGQTGEEQIGYDVKKTGIVGGTVLAEAIKRSLKSATGFNLELGHLINLEQQLGNFYPTNRNSKEGYASEDATRNAVIGAQEAVANKNLRNRLEESYFQLEKDFKEYFSSEQLEKMPKAMYASLGLLKKAFGEDQAGIERLAATFFTGQVFKNQSSVDQFNYFLLEFQTDNGEMKDVLESSMPLMETSPESKKKVLALTQSLRNFNALDNNPAAHLAKLNVDLNSVSHRADALMEGKSNTWRVALLAEIETMKQEGETIDKTDEKEQRKLAQRLSKKQERLERGPAAEELTPWKKEVVSFINTELDNLTKEYFEHLSTIFREKSGVTLTSVEVGKFLERFKNPGDVFIYLGKLSEYPHQKNLFQTFIERVAKGEFVDGRYLDRTHLDVVFGKDSPAEKTWRENLRLGGEEKSEEVNEFEEARKRIEGFVREALFHEHATGEFKEIMDGFLKAEPDERTEMLRLYRTKLPAENAPEEELTEDQKMARAVSHVMRFITLGETELQRSKFSNQVDPDGTKYKGVSLEKAFKEMSSIFSDDSPFLHDIESIKSVVEESKKSSKEGKIVRGLYVEESEDPDLLLRMGTDVIGSCQNLNGTPSLNRNLISYIMDGKIKTVFVRDSAGDIVGRSVMRVLQDGVTKKPVIMLERSYHSGNAPVSAVDRMLFDLAKNKAETMGYPLVLSNRFNADQKIEPYNNHIESFGGPGDTEYVDTIGGSYVSQKYTIPSGRVFSVV